MPTNTLLVSTNPNLRNYYIYPCKASERIHKVRLWVRSDKDVDYLKRQLDFALHQLRPSRIVVLNDQRESTKVSPYNLISKMLEGQKRKPDVEEIKV